MKVKCLKCGSKVSDSEESCRTCGTKLRWYQKNSPVTFGLMIVSLVVFAFVILIKYNNHCVL